MLTAFPDRRAGAGLGHASRCAALTAAWAARGSGTAWTVIDDYHATVDQQRAARADGSRVLLIDDHGSIGRYDADLVLDQNLGATQAAYGRSRALLGPRYLLLRPEFVRMARDRRPTERRAGPIRVVVSGGGEPSPEVSSFMDTVAEDLGAVGHDVVVLRGVADVASVLADADVMVGASGSTAYESCAAGTPMVLFAVAANQEPLGEQLATAGAALYLGRFEKLVAVDAIAAVMDLRTDELNSMADAARTVVDGRGADRVVAQMRSFDIELRPAREADCGLVLEWANDAGVRSQSFDSSPIYPDEHQRWFEDQVRNPDKLLLMAESDGRAIGQIRFDCSREPAILSFSIAAADRGHGWGAPLLAAGVARLRAERPDLSITGLVKPANLASAASFDIAGFDAAPRSAGDQPLRFQLPSLESM